MFSILHYSSPYLWEDVHMLDFYHYCSLQHKAVFHFSESRPTVYLWLKRVSEINDMEDLVVMERGLQDKFFKKWFYLHYFTYSERSTLPCWLKLSSCGLWKLLCWLAESGICRGGHWLYSSLYSHLSLPLPPSFFSLFLLLLPHFSLSSLFFLLTFKQKNTRYRQPNA